MNFTKILSENRRLQPASLLFLLTDTHILLARKKRGFGMGYLNGVGGKPEPGETIEQTANRECQEEIGVTPLAMTHAADLTFYLDMAAGPFDLQVTAYLCHEWEGQPTESEEMAPEWVLLSTIPYGKMWADDIFWLPQVLQGRFVTATFYFDAQDQVTDQKVVARNLV